MEAHCTVSVGSWQRGLAWTAFDVSQRHSSTVQLALTTKEAKCNTYRGRLGAEWKRSQTLEPLFDDIYVSGIIRRGWVQCAICLVMMSIATSMLSCTQLFQHFAS